MENQNKINSLQNLNNQSTLENFYDGNDLEEILSGFEENKILKKLILKNNLILAREMRLICKGIEKNRYLKEINFSRAEIEEEGFQILFNSLKKLDSLEKVDFGYVRFGEIGIKCLSECLESNLPNLKELNLSYAHLEKNCSLKIFESLLKNDKIETLGLNAIYSLEKERYLVSELLKKNKTLKKIELPEFIEISIIEALKTNTSLKSISFIVNEMNLKPIFELIKLNKYKKITFLPHDLNDQDMTELFEIIETDNILKSIDVTGNKVKIETFKKIVESLKKNKTLKKINFSKMEFNFENYKSISELLIKNTTIQSLNLSEHSKDKKMKEIKILFETLKNNNSLKKLDIGGIFLSEQELESLSEMLIQNSNLEFVSISFSRELSFNNKFVKQFYAALKNCSLKEIHFSNTSSVKRIETMNPFCELIESNSPNLKKIKYSNIFVQLDTLQSIYNSLKKNFNLTRLKIMDLYQSEKYNFFDRKIRFLLNCNKLWKPNNHIYFSQCFRRSVFTLVLCLRQKQNSLFFKIPKFILFEIIKRINRRSFKINNHSNNNNIKNKRKRESN